MVVGDCRRRGFLHVDLARTSPSTTQDNVQRHPQISGSHFLLQIQRVMQFILEMWDSRGNCHSRWVISGFPLGVGIPHGHSDQTTLFLRVMSAITYEDLSVFFGSPRFFETIVSFDNIDLCSGKPAQGQTTLFPLFTRSYTAWARITTHCAVPIAFATPTTIASVSAQHG